MTVPRVKRILIMKFCCFGDLVFISPVISSLKLNYPDSHIALICSPWVKEIAPYFNDLDDVVEFPLNEKGNIISKLIQFIKLIFLIRSGKYDTAFLGHRNNAFGYILMFSGIKNIFGFNETKYVNLGTEFDKNAYEPMRYLSVLEKQGLQTVNKLSLKNKISRDSLKQQYGLDKKYTMGLFPFGGINPGTNMEIKRWDTEKYIALSELLLKAYVNFNIILIEGKENSEKINKETSCKKFTVDADLISVCDVFVSGDTGPLHIASAFNVNTVSIFGPSNPDLIAPKNEFTVDSMNEVVYNKVYCSPCYTPETAVNKNSDRWEGDKFICYMKTNECIKNITVEEVKDKIEKIVKLKKMI